MRPVVLIHATQEYAVAEVQLHLLLTFAVVK
jgi:hypothetical protein